MFHDVQVFKILNVTRIKVEDEVLNEKKKAIFASCDMILNYYFGKIRIVVIKTLSI